MTKKNSAPRKIFGFSQVDNTKVLSNIRQEEDFELVSKCLEVQVVENIENVEEARIKVESPSVQPCYVHLARLGTDSLNWPKRVQQPKRTQKNSATQKTPRFSQKSSDSPKIDTRTKDTIKEEFHAKEIEKPKKAKKIPPKCNNEQNHKVIGDLLPNDLEKEVQRPAEDKEIVSMTIVGQGQKECSELPDRKNVFNGSQQEKRTQHNDEQNHKGLFDLPPKDPEKEVQRPAEEKEIISVSIVEQGQKESSELLDSKNVFKGSQQDKRAQHNDEQNHKVLSDLHLKNPEKEVQRPAEENDIISMSIVGQGQEESSELPDSRNVFKGSQQDKRAQHNDEQDHKVLSDLLPKDPEKELQRPAEEKEIFSLSMVGPGQKESSELPDCKNVFKGSQQDKRAQQPEITQRPKRAKKDPTGQNDEQNHKVLGDLPPNDPENDVQGPAEEKEIVSTLIFSMNIVGHGQKESSELPDSKNVFKGSQHDKRAQQPEIAQRPKRAKKVPTGGKISSTQNGSRFSKRPSDSCLIVKKLKSLQKIPNDLKAKVKTPVKCRICDKIFRDKYHRKRHEKIHIKAGELLPTDAKEPVKEKKVFSCQICNKIFNKPYKLKRHENVHIKTGELSPTDGEKQLKTSAKEKKIPSECNVSPLRGLKKNFECKVCHKTFVDGWKLRRHEKVHEK